MYVDVGVGIGSAVLQSKSKSNIIRSVHNQQKRTTTTTGTPKEVPCKLTGYRASARSRCQVFNLNLDLTKSVVIILVVMFTSYKYKV